MTTTQSLTDEELVAISQYDLRCCDDLPPAPALSQGFGGETDAMEMRGDSQQQRIESPAGSQQARQMRSVMGVRYRQKDERNEGKE